MRSPRLLRPPPSAVAEFRTGDAVEVVPDEPGFRGAHLAARVARVLSGPRRYTVCYDALVASDGSGRPLRETVDARLVRPRPPPPASPPREPPAEHAAVDALFNDAWWLGVVGGGAGGEGRVTVCFPETREVMEFAADDLRPHLEWVAGEWHSPESMAMPKTLYSEGIEVEVAQLEDNSVVAWFPAVIAKTIWKNNFLVEYTSVKSNGSALSWDIVNLKHIRPHPPCASVVSFFVNDEVEAFHGDGWWQGMITKVNAGSMYTFKSANLGKEVELDQKVLRLRYDWVHGQWKHVSQRMAKTTFTKGSRVEVSSNDEGFRGAWHQATVLKSVGCKFLVEYETLKADDETTPLTETVEVQRIRPSPPDIPVTNGFKFLDEVDAFYNDGWWVGMISKVIGNQIYKVYFKPWKEEIEFRHNQLRLHSDWVGGRWIRATPALAI